MENPADPDENEELRNALSDVSKPYQRSPMAETLSHPVDPDNFRESIAETVTESPVPYIRVYADGGCFREQREFTDAELEVVDRLRVAVDPQPKACYRNSKLALFIGRTIEGHTIEYVEGVVSWPDMPYLTTHAWVEVNGAVVELTLDEEDGIEYYGREFDRELVLSEREDGSISASPVAFEVCSTS